jgi:hypothetical protein
MTDCKPSLIGKLMVLADNHDGLPTACIELIDHAWMVYRASCVAPIVLSVPDKSRSTNRILCEHYRSRNKRHQDLHDDVNYELAGKLGCSHKPADYVVFEWLYGAKNHVRDHDNLVGSMKPYRDAVARFFGVDDRDASEGGRIAWDCTQTYSKGCDRRIQIKLYWLE